MWRTLLNYLLVQTHLCKHSLYYSIYSLKATPQIFFHPFSVLIDSCSLLRAAIWSDRDKVWTANCLTWLIISSSELIESSRPLQLRQACSQQLKLNFTFIPDPLWKFFYFCSHSMLIHLNLFYRFPLFSETIRKSNFFLPFLRRVEIPLLNINVSNCFWFLWLGKLDIYFLHQMLCSCVLLDSSARFLHDVFP